MCPPPTLSRAFLSAPGQSSHGGLRPEQRARQAHAHHGLGRPLRTAAFKAKRSKREQAHIKTWAHNRVVGVGIVFDEEVLGLGLVDKRRLEGVVDIGGDRLLAVAQRARATDSVRASQVEASSRGAGWAAATLGVHRPLEARALSEERGSRVTYRRRRCL